jgi:hypothetical protein
LVYKKAFPVVLLMTVIAASAQNTTAKNKTERLQLAAEIDKSIRTELLR